MITVFICNEANCPNEGIVYRMEDANAVAMCGGCKAQLIGTPEESE